MEGRDWFLDIDSTGSVGQTGIHPISGTYRRYQQRDERFTGELSTSESDGHMAIFPSGDTLRDVRAVKTNIAITIHGRTPGPLNQADRLRTHRFRIVRLYARDSALPVAVCMESDYEGRLGDGSTAYIFPLAGHLLQPQLAKTNLQNQSHPNQSDRASGPTVPDPDGNNRVSGSMRPDAVTVSTEGDALTVNVDSRMLPADIRVYDMAGRLLAARRITGITTAINGIPAGEILVTIYPDDKTIPPLSHKIHNSPH